MKSFRHCPMSFAPPLALTVYTIYVIINVIVTRSTKDILTPIDYIYAIPCTVISSYCHLFCNVRKFYNKCFLTFLTFLTCFSMQKTSLLYVQSIVFFMKVINLLLVVTAKMILFVWTNILFFSTTINLNFNWKNLLWNRLMWGYSIFWWNIYFILFNSCI